MGSFGAFQRTDDPPEISIDGKLYPVSSWTTVSTGQILERRYDKGFIGGVGPFSEFSQSRPDQLHAAFNMDTSSFPYLRLTPQRSSIDATTGGDVDGADPTYFFAEEDASNNVYIYMLNGRYAKKFDVGLGTLHSTKDFGASAVCGRPVLFEGDWCIPLGAAVDATRLTTVATDANADTYTAMTGIKALHFAVGMQEGIAQIIRCGNDTASNIVDISASASSPSFGDDFEVGDSSLPITDAITIGGRLMICKADSAWYFSIDGGGNAYQVTELIDQAGDLSASPQFVGSNSASHGPYGYYCHPSGIWRILGDGAVPVDLNANPTYATLTFASSTPTTIGISWIGPWTSVATYGRWIYATEDVGGLWHGYINADGTIRWHGNLFSPNGTSLTAKCRVGIVKVPTGLKLYLLDTVGKLFEMPLEADGGIRHQKTTLRGGDSETSLAIAPETSFDEPEKLKQVRMMWVYIDNMIAANFTVKLGVYRDRSGTFTQVGSNITATGGKIELEATPGTNDTFYYCFPVIEAITGDINPATSDPRFRDWGIRCVTPTIYRAVIPLDTSKFKGASRSIYDAMNALRDIKNGASITVGEIGNDDTWTGYVEDIREETVTDTLGNAQHQFTVDIGRWVW